MAKLVARELQHTPLFLPPQAAAKAEASDDEALALVKQDAFNLLWSDSLFVGRSPLYG